MEKSSDGVKNWTDGLRPHQQELQRLAQLADIRIHPNVFRIIIIMLNNGVDPKSIYSLFKKNLRYSRDIGGNNNKRDTVGHYNKKL